jgi:hypothetical protein
MCLLIKEENMKTFYVVMAEYKYPVAVEEYQIRGRAVMHAFVARDFLEAIDIKNQWIKEREKNVRMAKAQARA